MKKLSIAVAALALMAVATSAHAGDHASFECAGFKATPPEARDDDPVVATSVELYWPLHQNSPSNFDVNHTTLNGENYFRGEQYRNVRMWSNSKGDYWSGVSVKDSRRTMVGQMIYGDSSHGYYVEKAYVNGRLERATTSTCKLS